MARLLPTLSAGNHDSRAQTVGAVACAQLTGARGNRVSPLDLITTSASCPRAPDADKFSREYPPPSADLPNALSRRPIV